jgi:parallel beta-helix repeat protein
MKTVVPGPGIAIREDAALEPGVYDLGGRDGILIDADGITVDGRGAVLRAGARPPPLPEQGDFLYTPGDLSLHREEHVLALRALDVPEGALELEHRSWGTGAEAAEVTFSADRVRWTAASPTARTESGGGWHESRHSLGRWGPGPLHLRFGVPAAVLDPASPLFFDGFRLLLDGREIWRGDARENWSRWYNTGFSILKRGDRRYYGGVGIRSTGRSGVRLRNLRVEGFLTALHLRDCRGWLIEGNDFSDNYDDPDYGWGDGTESSGAVYLEGVTGSTLRGNRGHRVWNGISLRRSSGNRIETNEFSRCSNACLKMTQSSDNLVTDNVLSWGIRIYPEEVHARDSVSLLLESGSDRNRFLRNDFSHGGDGIFIRVLNHWCSVGNHFELNDCSQANNNAVESWSPGNTYVANKASFSSYGFWLGGSDDTLLLDNEVRHNGERHRNAPEPFGNAGVSVVHGSSSSFVMAGNTIEANSGPGLSLAFRESEPARHWLVVDNDIRSNRDDPRGYAGHGVFAELCDGLWLLGNRIEGNGGVQVRVGRDVRHLTLDRGECRLVRGLRLEADRVPVAGGRVLLTVSDPSPEHAPFAEYDWDLGSGRHLGTREPRLEVPFVAAGLARVCVTARGRGAAGSVSRTMAVLPRGTPIAECSEAAGWELRAPAGSSLQAEREPSASGRGSLLATVRRGRRCSLATDLRADVRDGADLARGSGVAFYYRYSCELFVHTGKRNRNVGIRLLSRDGRAHERWADLSWDRAPSEERYDWVLFTARWEDFGGEGPLEPASARRLEIGFGPDEPADCLFRLDALRLLEA